MAPLPAVTLVASVYCGTAAKVAVTFTGPAIGTASGFWVPV